VTTGHLADGRAVSVIDLAQPVHPGIPHSPNHPGYRHALLRRHGDLVRADGTSGANDIITLGTHTATHLDALAHISHDGRLHGGAIAAQEQTGGVFTRHGVHTVAPIVAPGALIDLPRLVGRDRLEAGERITVDMLQAAAGDLVPGSAVLIRTGWAQLWDDATGFLSHEPGVPGPDAAGCRWLAEHSPVVVGSDTTAFEWIPAGEGHARLPGHRVLLVEHGIPIMEMLNLEQLADAHPSAFTVVAAPLRLVGATGSPLRPLALLEG
jgi:kynurenine formamidase